MPSNRFLLILTPTVACLLAYPLLAQSRDLRADLRDLNVRVTSPHYALSGTVETARLEEFAAALEFIHAEYALGFDELLVRSKAEPPEKQKTDGADEGERFHVVVLAREDEYREFTGAYFRRFVEHTRGLFVPAVDLLIVLDAGDREETYATLYHEAFHQFLDRHVPHAPMWVNEGLATYYETARASGGKLRLDRPNDAFFQIVKSAADAKMLIPLDEVLSAGLEDFYDTSEMPGLSVPRAAVYYAQAYTLCAFIVNDPEGRHLLRRYLQALSAAESADAAARITGEMFPPSLLEKLVTPWLAYVNKN